MNEAVPIWVTLLGFAAPLIALAGSAVGYVVKLYQFTRMPPFACVTNSLN